MIARRMLSGWWTWFVLAGTALFAGIFVFACNRLSRRQVEALRRTQDALQQSEQRYRRLVETAPEAIMVLDLDEDRLVDANAAAERLFGFSTADLRDKSFADLCPEHQPDGRSSAEVARELALRALAGETVTTEWVHRAANGRDLYCDVLLVRQPGTARSRVRGTIINASRRKEVERQNALLEDQLQTSRRLEALGRMAGGVSHDFNNILTAMTGETDLLRMRLGPDPDPEVREHLDELSASIDRAAALTKQLLALSRRQVSNPRLLDLNHTLRAMTPLLRRVVPEDIEILIRTAERGAVVRADSNQIEQVVMNLVANARDALPEGGTVSIETSVRPGQANGGAAQVELTVCDNGEGIDPKALPHVFDPFFTTKAAGRGTGLGLATVYGIVQQSGGTIAVDSEPGVGTMFCVSLPQATEPPTEQQLVIPRRPPRGAETVLVCDDDRAVLRSIQAMLSVHGYKVLAASTPAQALEFAHEHDDVALLVTDVVMPVMNGRELAAGVTRLRPGIQVLYVSGYTSDVISSRGLASEGINLLPKPFSTESLLRHVRETLDGDRAATASDVSAGPDFGAEE